MLEWNQSNIMAQPTHRYILKSATMIAPKVRHLAFMREGDLPLPFTAGQFITLHIEGPNKILHRSYSIANPPNIDNTIEIACAYVEGGISTGVLFGLEPGAIISASGPHGLFVLKEERPARYVLIATGTGVTPYRSMLNEIRHRFVKKHPELEVIVIFGVRSPEELLFKDEFLDFAEENPGFKFYACYSREAGDFLQPFERIGHVQSIFNELSLDPAKDIVYLCGNPNMIDDNFSSLTEMGFDKKMVRREKYLFAPRTLQPSSVSPAFS